MLPGAYMLMVLLHISRSIQAPQIPSSNLPNMTQKFMEKMVWAALKVFQMQAILLSWIALSKFGMTTPEKKTVKS
jgi:hypothetical protein